MKIIMTIFLMVLTLVPAHASFISYSMEKKVLVLKSKTTYHRTRIPQTGTTLSYTGELENGVCSVGLIIENFGNRVLKDRVVEDGELINVNTYRKNKLEAKMRYWVTGHDRVDCTLIMPMQKTDYKEVKRYAYNGTYDAVVLNGESAKTLYEMISGETNRVDKTIQWQSYSKVYSWLWTTCGLKQENNLQQYTCEIVDFKFI